MPEEPQPRRLDLREVTTYRRESDGTWTATISDLQLTAQGASREAAWTALYAKFQSMMASSAATRARLVELMQRKAVAATEAEYRQALAEASDRDREGGEQGA